MNHSPGGKPWSLIQPARSSAHPASARRTNRSYSQATVWSSGRRRSPVTPETGSTRCYPVEPHPSGRPCGEHPPARGAADRDRARARHHPSDLAAGSTPQAPRQATRVGISVASSPTAATGTQGGRPSGEDPLVMDQDQPIFCPECSQTKPAQAFSLVRGPLEYGDRRARPCAKCCRQQPGKTVRQ